MATLLALPAGLVPRAHTSLSALAFVTALFLGWAAGLWEQLCENAVSAWPVEWFPSVSATIGDHAAPRAPFHILIALTAGPRFALLGLQWIAHRYPPVGSRGHTGNSAASSSAVQTGADSTRRRTRSASAKLDNGNGNESTADEADLAPAPRGLVDVEVCCGLARTFCCGGWMFITSRDQHDLHDLFMIVYLVLNVPWMVLSTLHSTNDRARRWRIATGLGFLASIPPLIYLFIEHSVKHVPGAYTRYAFFEWSLVFWDVAFDAGCMFELDHLQLLIVDTTRAENGKTGSPSTGSLFLAPTAKRPRAPADWTALPSPESQIPHRALLAWFSDVWFATAFWTMFTSVSVQLFYWSVWSLALTGSELAIFVNIQPFMFSRRGSREFNTSRDGIFTNRAILYIVGLGCYKLPNNAARFLCAVIAVWCGWAAFLGDSFRLRGSLEAYANAKIFLTGLLLSMVLKYANHSNNPFWPILDESSGGWNKTGLLISALALAETYYRPNKFFAAPPTDVKDKPTAVTTTRTQRLCFAFGIGSLFNLLQTFVMDGGTIISWTWTGFPVTGPTLHPWGGVVIAVASLGLAIDLPVLEPKFWFASAPAAVGLVYYPDWIGFIGGLFLVFHIVTITPTLLRAATAMPPNTWGQAMCWNAFLDVAAVFTVAYAFVPYGWILRERTDIIMLILLLPIPAALWAASKLSLPGKADLQARSVSRVALSSKWTKISAILLAGAALGLGYERNLASASQTNKPVPYYPDHNILTGGIFTVHFGIDEPGRDSQRRIAQLIDEMQVDVLGMLETDLHRFVYGNRDLTRYIAEELGYYVDLGPGPNQHTWGACLLSKFPILNSTHHLLPSPSGELAPAIHATLDVHGQKVNVIVSHNGQEEDPVDRELQTTELARLLHETGDTPTMFLGYLITHLGDEAPSPYGILFNDHTGLIDIETLDSWRWCEYLGFRNLWRIAYARLEHSDVTDTELQVGKFILPLPGTKAEYNSKDELYWHIGEDDVPEPWRLPSMFRGDGVRGHSYRIWNGPLYYNPPYHSGVREYGWGNNTQWPPSYTGNYRNS